MIGIDLVELEEAAQIASPAMLRRIFSPAEVAAAGASDPRPLMEAFAVKEAVLKALGWGIGAGVSRLREVEYVRSTVRLHGAVARAAESAQAAVALTVPLDGAVLALAFVGDADGGEIALALEAAARDAARRHKAGRRGH